MNAVRAWLHQVRMARWAHFLVLPLSTFDPHAVGAGAVTAALRGVASAFALLAFGYLLNSVADREMDLDVRKNPFVAGGQATYSLAALLSISLLLALASPWPARLATLACLSFAWIYSTGPRIKSIPIVGTLANLGNFVPLLFVGMPSAALPPRFGSLAVAFSAMLLQNQLIHEAGDAVEDRGGGVRTTWLTLGPARTSVVAALLGLLAAGAAGRIVAPGLATVAALLVGAVFAVGFPAVLATRGRQPECAARLRVVHRWYAAGFGTALFVAWRWAA